MAFCLMDTEITIIKKNHFPLAGWGIFPGSCTLDEMQQKTLGSLFALTHTCLFAFFENFMPSKGKERINCPFFMSP